VGTGSIATPPHPNGSPRSKILHVAGNIGAVDVDVDVDVDVAVAVAALMEVSQSLRIDP